MRVNRIHDVAPREGILVCDKCMEAWLRKGRKMDHRYHSHYPSSVKQDHERMLLIIHDGEIELHAEYQVCPACRGAGKYVNPDIDSHGLSADDFAEDPDFQEGYMSGRYDITCRSCGGRRVILVPTTEEGRGMIEGVLAEEATYRAEVAAERRMGV